MRTKATSALVAAILFVGQAVGANEGDMTGNLISDSTSWRFFTDGVMGGVSTGGATFGEEDGQRFLRMTGAVSTANNGGFIQTRADLSEVPSDAEGVRLSVRGNNQTYYVHLRTDATVKPWQYYQAGFEVTGEWQEVRLPFADFAPSGRMLEGVPSADSVKSLAVAAFGRDHDARIDVRDIGFY